MKDHEFIEMKIPAKADYVGVVRLSISGIASRLGFAYDAIEDLKVAVSEAITNAVEHAYNKNGEGEVTIGFGLYQDRLETVVADHGDHFDLNELKGGVGPYKGSESVEELQENGFGLFLIDALMDKLEITNDDGAIVLMTKFLNETEVGVDDDQIPTTR
ncbi:anti-sigma B factor RsbW [Barrientosiimonas marina]|uniref:Serine-protein kinase RsbW n=1 Tax=Lentibacillus kimchii TaxID=1542911 RepID=A0ABW2UYK5_9BACI